GPPPRSPLFPYTTLFRSPHADPERPAALWELRLVPDPSGGCFIARPAIDYPLELLDALEGEFSRRFSDSPWPCMQDLRRARLRLDRKSTRLNSSHVKISY